MNKKRMKKYLVIGLVILECLTLTLTMKSYSNRELSNLVEENKVDKKKFSMYIENDTGNYEEYTTSEIFPVGYKLNLDKSSCTDTNGNIVEGMLSSIDNKVTITSNKTTYCYLYFDLEPILSNLCTSGDNLGSCLTTNNSEIESLSNDIQGDMYRYQGTNDTVTDNYICFGTTDSSECTSNTDAYMYRIIGVNESGQLKLIKKEALNTAYAWNSSTGVDWANSELYTGLNGDYYLSNSTYMPSGWSNKISDTTWKYGDTTSNASYNGATAYTTEQAWTSTVSNYIGLMYQSDYLLAYSGGNPGSNSNAKTSWIHLNNCDSGAPSTGEWLMSRYTSAYAWSVDSNGILYGYSYSMTTTASLSVRPVFYLNADEVYMSGDGTLDNPIMLSEPELSAGETIISKASTGLDTTTQYGDMYRYQGTTADNYLCFGYSDYETDCDFTNTTNSDRYAYRIVGINSSGQLKLIKKEALNTAYAWNSSTGVSWNSASLYTNLNGSYFYSNTTYVPDSWKSKIALTTWKYGDTTSNASYNGATAYTTEQAWTSTVSNYIGLMYQSDYLLAYSGGNPGSYSNAKTSWIFLFQSGNDSAPPNTSYEWLMSRYDSPRAWYVFSSGTVGYATMANFSYSVRPVFYLTSDVQFVDGTGTSSNPFIIE